MSRPTGASWWWALARAWARSPRSWRAVKWLATYQWKHRHCDTSDFHHGLGCAVTGDL